MTVLIPEPVLVLFADIVQLLPQCSCWAWVEIRVTLLLWKEPHLQWREFFITEDILAVTKADLWPVEILRRSMTIGSVQP